MTEQEEFRRIEQTDRMVKAGVVITLLLAILALCGVIALAVKG